MNLLSRWGRVGWHHFLAAVIVAGLMSVALGMQIEKRASILRNGADIVLQTTPVDPRDLLRGDYVILNYEISRVPASLVTGPAPALNEWNRLWVRLKPGSDGLWTVAEASFAELPVVAGNVLIRSHPLYVYDTSPDQTYQVNYGIERFYVPEGEGLVIENARDEMAVAIAARVNASGDAQIRALMVDGVQVYSEPLY